MQPVANVLSVGLITELTAQGAGPQLLKDFEESADQDLSGQQKKEAIGEPLAVVGSGE
jgi:hypothetical protein